MYISVDSWILFSISGYNLILCCGSDCSSCGHWEFFQLVLVTLWHVPTLEHFCEIFVYLAFNYYLALKDDVGLSSTFSSPVIDSTIFPRFPGFFHWRMAFKNEIWVLSILIAGTWLVSQWYRICLPVQETQIQSLGWEDCLEKEMATHSSILAWKSHGQRSLAGYSPWDHRVRHDFEGKWQLRNPHCCWGQHVRILTCVTICIYG